MKYHSLTLLLVQEWDSILSCIDKVMKEKTDVNKRILKELETKMMETRIWMEKELNVSVGLAARSELHNIGRPLNNLPIQAEKVCINLNILHKLVQRRAILKQRKNRRDQLAEYHGSQVEEVGDIEVEICRICKLQFASNLQVSFTHRLTYYTKQLSVILNYLLIWMMMRSTCK